MKNKYNTLILLVFNILFFIILAIAFPIRYETNDDVFMCWIANGVLGGEPDCHLVFINAIYGVVLKFLYTLVPKIEWYTLLFCLFHIAAVTTLSKAVLDVPQKLVKYGLLVLVYSIWARCIFYFQFTTTSGLLAAAGVLMLTKKKYNIAGVFLVLSSLIRYEATGLVILVSLPLLIFKLGKEWRSCFIPCSFIILSMAALYLGNNLFYMDKEWKEYKEYTDVSCMNYDDPNIRDIKSENLPAGFTPNDLQALVAFFPDPHVATTEVQKSLYEKCNTVSSNDRINNIRIFLGGQYKSIGMIALLFILLFFIDGRVYARVFLLLTYILWILLLCYISYSGFVKNRVYLCSLLPLLLCCMEVCYQQKRGFFKPNVMSAFMSLLLISYPIVRGLYHESMERKEFLNTKFKDQITLIKRNTPQRLTFRAVTYTVECYSPFELNNPVHNIGLVVNGWTTKIPFFDIRQSNLDFVTKDFTFMAKSIDDMQWFRTSILEHYNTDIKIVTIDSSNSVKLVNFIEVKK